MLPVKKIICPTDFSDFSYKALEVAEELCREFGAQLCLIHVVTPIPKAMGSPTATGFDIPRYEEDLAEQSKKMLKRLIKERVAKSVKTEAEVVHGLEADSIVKMADEKDADLIVIATHGHTGLKHLFLGSVAEKVLRHSAHPVLTIKAAEDE